MVLHDAAHPAPGHKMGPPLAGAHDACWQLKRQGHKLVIHSARCATLPQVAHICDWLVYFSFPRMDVCVYKPVADCYIDDLGYRFTDWPSTLEYLTELNRGR